MLKYEKDIVVINDGGIYATGLPQVFDPGMRPCINTEGGTTRQIIDQVKKCPSGALTTSLNSRD